MKCAQSALDEAPLGLLVSLWTRTELLVDGVVVHGARQIDVYLAPWSSVPLFHLVCCSVLSDVHIARPKKPRKGEGEAEGKADEGKTKRERDFE